MKTVRLDPKSKAARDLIKAAAAHDKKMHRAFMKARYPEYVSTPRRFPKGNPHGPTASYVAEFCALNNLTTEKAK